jgi:hypothetical protein
LLLSTVACSDQAATSAAADNHDADVDVKAVHDVEAAWSRDAGAKNADKFAGYYADDGSWLLFNAPI